MSAYRIPAAKHRVEFSVKRSRFIATAAPAANREAVSALLEDVRREFPDARHHCWACVAGAPDDASAYGSGDDGEPKGTAGAPMLNVLRHSGMGQIAVVATRYFGGIKLGANGLARAYSRCVSAVLEELATDEHVDCVDVEAKLQYTSLASVEHWLNERGVAIAERTFSEHVTLVMRVPVTVIDEFCADILDLGQGRFEVHVQSE